MSNEVITKPPADLDGFASGYSEPVAAGSGGGNTPSTGFLGLKLKFGLDARWTDPSGNEVTAALVALDVLNRVHKWAGDGGGPLETITLKPGEAWPDITALNEGCKTEWYEKFGKMVGPWAGEHVVVFVNPTTMDQFWWPSPTSTIGACIAVRRLIQQTSHMRNFRGETVYPLIKLGHVHMPTQYGGRERPNLEVLRFVTLGGGTSRIEMKTVEPISLKEEVKDALPF
jgi:hypothetical protein